MRRRRKTCYVPINKSLRHDIITPTTTRSLIEYGILLLSNDRLRGYLKTMMSLNTIGATLVEESSWVRFFSDFSVGLSVCRLI